MTTAPPWEQRDAGDGAMTYRLRSWSAFSSFLDGDVFGTTDSGGYVWRGQRRSDWNLGSSLDRLFAQLGIDSDFDHRSQEHLERFKYAARGRRGLNPPKLEDREWWALGQHYGLATPLLDWSRSPFAAAYFAFETLAPDATEYRVVYGLDVSSVDAKNVEIMLGPSLESGRAPVIEFIDPLSDENPRLVSQGSLFTRAPIGTPVERWVAQAFEGSTHPVLLRIEIPDGDRLPCLRALNRMNINHVSLFPDLTGASRFVNLRAMLENG